MVPPSLKISLGPCMRTNERGKETASIDKSYLQAVLILVPHARSTRGSRAGVGGKRPFGSLEGGVPSAPPRGRCALGAPWEEGRLLPVP